MWTWLSRFLRSSTAAERAEADGRVDAAVRLYIESGDRPEAVQVLLRAADSARSLDDRRGYLSRAYAIARTPESRDAVRRALALVTLSEAQAVAPRTAETRRRLVEAAAELEAVGAYQDAGKAFGILEDREAVVRVLALAGDVDSLERETAHAALEDHLELRRRGALEDFDALWRSGDRARAAADLRRWVEAHPGDHEAREALDTRTAWLVRAPCFDAEIDGVRHIVIGRLPVVLGRDGDVVVRGGSVSRRHCRLALSAAGIVLDDVGSHAGTRLDGIPVAGGVILSPGRNVQLGTDLFFSVTEVGHGAMALEITRGMDRGRRLVVVATLWDTPFGPLTFDTHGPSLAPAAPVSLNGQKVAVPLTLCRGDTVEGAGHTLRVLP